MRRTEYRHVPYLWSKLFSSWRGPPPCSAPPRPGLGSAWANCLGFHLFIIALSLVVNCFLYVGNYLKPLINYFRTRFCYLDFRYLLTGPPLKLTPSLLASLPSHVDADYSSLLYKQDIYRCIIFHSWMFVLSSSRLCVWVVIIRAVVQWNVCKFKSKRMTGRLVHTQWRRTKVCEQHEVLCQCLFLFQHV